MKNMQEMTERNQNAAMNPGQFGTNMMGPGAYQTGMGGMNPMMGGQN